MKFFDIADETELETSKNDNSILIDNIQAAINTINDSIDELEASMKAADNSLNASIAEKETDAKKQLDSAVKELKNEINSLSDNLSKKVITDEATVSNISITNASITDADITGLKAETLNADSIEAKKVKADEAEITNASITETLKAVNAEIENLEADKFSMEAIEAAKAEIKELTAEIANVKTLEIEAITAADDDKWHTPNTTPNNEELLKITIPAYDGIIQVITRDNEFNLTIFNGSGVSFTQNDTMPIYRVEVESKTINIYLQNIGDSISYKLLYIGNKAKDKSTSEIVDRAKYDSNINTKKSFVLLDVIDPNGINGLSVVSVETLPASGTDKTIYIVNNDKSYYSDGTDYFPMTFDETENIDFNTFISEE